jgi:hypothetical protein
MRRGFLRQNGHNGEALMSIVRVCIPAEGDDSFASYMRVKRANGALLRAVASTVEDAHLGTLDGDDFGNGVYRFWLKTSDPERLKNFLRERATSLGLPASTTFEVGK